MIDLNKMSDLELAKLLSEQKNLLFQTNQNVLILEKELNDRLLKVEKRGKNEISDVSTTK